MSVGRGSIVFDARTPARADTKCKQTFNAPHNPCPALFFFNFRLNPFVRSPAPPPLSDTYLLS